jgi:PBP1b-binding outer membrane lipoprotein LpoB
MRKTWVILGLVLAGCSKSDNAADNNGYPPTDAVTTAPVKKAVTAWSDCLIYGIKQVDNTKEPAVTIAEAAMAGCTRAETNLEDRLFDAMKKSGNPLEVRAIAADMVDGFRTRMRSQTIRWVLSKHAEERH